VVPRRGGGPRRSWFSRTDAAAAVREGGLGAVVAAVSTALRILNSPEAFR
jgi:hypothetical protein